MQDTLKRQKFFFSEAGASNLNGTAERAINLVATMETTIHTVWSILY